MTSRRRTSRLAASPFRPRWFVLESSRSASEVRTLLRAQHGTLLATRTGLDLRLDIHERPDGIAVRPMRAGDIRMPELLLHLEPGIAGTILHVQLGLPPFRRVCLYPAFMLVAAASDAVLLGRWALGYSPLDPWVLPYCAVFFSLLVAVLLLPGWFDAPVQAEDALSAWLAQTLCGSATPDAPGLPSPVPPPPRLSRKHIAGLSLFALFVLMTNTVPHHGWPLALYAACGVLGLVLAPKDVYAYKLDERARETWRRLTTKLRRK